MWSSVRRLCAVAAAVTGTWSCHSDFFVSDDFTGAVVTIVDSGPSLGAARTFVLPDTIVEVQQSTGSMTHAADHDITESVRRHLVNMGWRDLGNSPTARPDVLVLVAASMRIQTGVVYTDWYSGWGYLPYWSPSVNATWGWGAPTAIPYAFPAGTLFITMLDLNAQSLETQSIALLWTGVIDGVVSSGANTAQRALVGVDQAFSQSPYLTRAP